MDQVSCCCFDLETTNLSADFGVILCGVVKPAHGEAKVFRADKLNRKWDKCRSNDKDVTRAIVEELSQYDIWVAHNGGRFDVPFLRTRLAKWGLDPLPVRKLIDPVWLARNKLKMSYNSLEAIAKFLGVNSKTEVSGDHWLAASLDGSRKAMDYIVEHCLAPHHRVLTADLRWVPLGDLEVGDKLVGFDEENSGGWGRRYREAVVEQVHPDADDLYEVILSDNTVIQATADHRWLVGSSKKRGWKWVRTSKLRPAETAGIYSTKLYRIFDVWSHDKSWESGYLAGILDGEGYINGRAMYAFGQRPGVVLEAAKACVGRFGTCTCRLVEGEGRPGGFEGSKGDTVSVQVRGSLPDRVRILGTVRPNRLLQKIDVNSWGRMERRIGDGSEGDVGHGACEVVSVRRLGKGEIVRLKTSSATFFAEGLPMHNCVQDVLVLEKVIGALKAYSTTYNAWGSGY